MPAPRVPHISEDGAGSLQVISETGVIPVVDFEAFRQQSVSVPRLRLPLAGGRILDGSRSTMVTL